MFNPGAIAGSSETQRSRSIPVSSSKEKGALADSVFFAKDLILAGHLAVGPEIAQQRKGQVLALGPRAMRVGVVDADPQDLGVVAADVVENLLYERQLAGADGRPVGRVERKDDIFAAIAAQLDRLRLAVRQCEIDGRFVRIRERSHGILLCFRNFFWILFFMPYIFYSTPMRSTGQYLESDPSAAAHPS
ncbi:MAG: hypothetical protein MPW14_18880 [Candidatus Manganitrophus sp.]|nr:MAG: hypothetical protein MPW14_18880 [Candidatus Manganitrophus sp.]